MCPSLASSAAAVRPAGPDPTTGAVVSGQYQAMAEACQQKMQGVETKLRVISAQQRLPADTELALFRIAQEALRNVSRHSSASQGQLTLEFDHSKATLTVADKGRGFLVPADLAQLSQVGKLGLIDIQERARLLGGTMKVKSKRGKGTTITVAVPL